MAEEFLDSFNFFSKWTSIFGFNNFPFPKIRTKQTKIKIKRIEKILTALKMCTLATILIINNILLRKEKKSQINSSITGYIVVFLNVTSLSMLATNLFIEVRFRSRIWAIITGICDVDNMVCTLFLSYLF